MDFLITNLISNDLKIIYLCIDEDDYAYSTKTRNMLSHSWKTSVHICLGPFCEELRRGKCVFHKIVLISFCPKAVQR
jgi:hypothetical protein